eukprot:6977659-Ditylum_brightwellii.AAC.1
MALSALEVVSMLWTLALDSVDPEHDNLILLMAPKLIHSIYSHISSLPKSSHHPTVYLIQNGPVRPSNTSAQMRPFIPAEIMREISMQCIVQE